MAIPRLDLILGGLSDDPEFLSLAPEKREEIINANMQVYLERNPDADSFQAYDSGHQLNKSLRRDLGEGRRQVDPNIAVAEIQSSLSPDYESMADSDKIKELNRLREITGDIAAKDPINSEDIKFQLDSILTQTERQIRGEDTGFIGDKFARIADGLVNAFVSPFDLEAAQRINRESFPENPASDENWFSQFAFGAGDFAGQTIMFLGSAPFITPYGSTGLLFGTNASRRFQDNYQQAKALGLDDDKAVTAGIASFPGSVVDSFGDAFVIGNFLPSSQASSFIKKVKSTPMPDKASVLVDGLKQGISTGTLKTVLSGFVAEGLSEAAGDYVSGVGGYLSTGYDEFVPSNSELLTSFSIGAVLGGAASGASIPFSGRGDVRALEGRAEEIENLSESARLDFIQKFESGNLGGALGVLKDFQKNKQQLERNQENVDARRQKLQEVQDGVEVQRETGQPQTVTQEGVEATAAPASQEAELTSLQEGAVRSVTNNLVRSIAGDRSVDEELDRALPQRAVIRSQILGARHPNIADQDRQDALTLLDTAIVKASQASGLDPAVAYDALNQGKGFRTATSKVEAKKLKKEGFVVLGLYKKADATTTHHELFHLVRQSGIFERAIGPELYSQVSEELGVQNDEWTDQQEGAIVDQYEEYLKSGVAKSDVLRDIFERVKEIFRKIYASLTGNGVELSETARKAFDELYNIDSTELKLVKQTVDQVISDPAKAEELQGLFDAVQQNQEEIISRTAASDVSREAVEAQRRLAIEQRFNQEIADWYRNEAQELGVVASNDSIDVAIDYINSKFGLTSQPQPTNQAEAFIESERVADEQTDFLQQDKRGSVSKIRKIGDPSLPKVSKESYDGQENVARSLRFIRNDMGKFQTEDKTLAKLLDYLGRNLEIAVGKGILDQKAISDVIIGVNNFYQSRNPAVRDNVERRLDTRKDIEEMSIIKEVYNANLASSLVDDWEPHLGPFTGNRYNLEEVRKWIYSVHPVAESNPPAHASDEMMQKLDDVTNKLVTTYEIPEAWVSKFEEYEGEIDNTFGLRDSIVRVISNVMNHLVTANTEGMIQKDAMLNFMATDAMLNVQVPGLIAKIGDQQYRQNAVEGARRLEGTWAEKWFNKVSKRLSVPIERVSLLNERVSGYTETQEFFANEIYGPFEEAILRTGNAYRVYLDRYLEAQKEHYDNLGFKERDKRSAAEHLHLTIALRMVQVELGSDFNEAIRNNFKEWDKTVANQRSRSNSEDQEVANAIEASVERLKALVDLESPTLYEDLKAELPRFLNYDQAGPDAVDSRIKYLDDIRAIFKDLRPGLKFITEAFRPGAFQEIIDYAPTSTIEAAPGAGRMDITSSGLEGDADAQYFKSPKKQVSEVKRRVGLSKDRFYDINMDRYIPRQILGVLFESYTTPSRFDLASLYHRDSEFSQIVTKGHADKRAFLERVVILNAENTLSRAQLAPDIVKGINAVKGQLVKIHLGSIVKLVTEPSASFTHFFLRTALSGRKTFENFNQALRLQSKFSQSNDFLKKYNRELYDRSASGEVETDRREFSKMVNRLPAWMRKIDKVTQHLLLPLRIGDGFASRTIFFSEYIRLLKATGQATSYLDVDFEKPDFKLIAQANRFTEEFVGVSGKEKRGFFFSDRDPKLAVIRNLLFSYQHHLSQLGQQLQRDIRDLNHLRGSNRSDLMVNKVRDIGGIVGQIAAFSMVRYGTIAMMSVFVTRLLKDLFDDEEGKLAELQKNIDNAPDKNSKMMAEQEYAQARIIRDYMNKAARRDRNLESMFKGVLRDELSGIHIIAGAANGLIPKVLVELPDRAIAEGYKEALNAQVSEMNDEIRRLKRFGRNDEARRLQEDRENLKDQEHISLFYNFPVDSGIPGIYGSVVDAFISPVQDGINMSLGLMNRPVQPFQISDLYLHFQLMGVGQSDINRYMKQINRIERDLWKQQREFDKREKPQSKPSIQYTATPSL